MSLSCWRYILHWASTMQCNIFCILQMLLHDVASCCIKLHDVAWSCMMLLDVACCCLILHDVAWYCMMLYDAAWYCMIFNLGKCFHPKTGDKVGRFLSTMLFSIWPEILRISDVPESSFLHKQKRTKQFSCTELNTGEDFSNFCSLLAYVR